MTTHEHGKLQHNHAHAEVPHNHLLRAICGFAECTGYATHDLHQRPPQDLGAQVVAAEQRVAELRALLEATKGELNKAIAAGVELDKGVLRRVIDELGGAITKKGRLVTDEDFLAHADQTTVTFDLENSSFMIGTLDD